MASGRLAKAALQMLSNVRFATTHANRSIHRAAQGGNMVRMVYKPAYDDRPRTYLVEPYSYRGDKFYAFHPKHGQIHSFTKSRIISAEPMKKEFEPQWEVEL